MTYTTYRADLRRAWRDYKPALKDMGRAVKKTRDPFKLFLPFCGFQFASYVMIIKVGWYTGKKILSKFP